MGYKEASGFCRACKRDVMVRKPSATHILHLILSLITGGLWLPIWLLVSLKAGKWRCSQCGREASRNF